MSKTESRKPYGSTRRRIMICADKTTESHILEAQSRLSDLTGVKPSLSVAIAYLVKEGHKATTAKNLPENFSSFPTTPQRPMTRKPTREEKDHRR